MTDLTAEAAWLRQLLGEWTYSFRTADESDHPGVNAEGSECARAISDHFVVLESRAYPSEGSEARSVTLIGFEVDARRFTGAVVSNAVAALFVYEGRLEEGALVLETEGPAMTEGNTTDRYRDVLKIIDENNRFTAAEVFQEGGWREFMRTTYRRKS